MQVNVVRIFKHLLKTSKSGRCQLFRLARRAQQQYVKPLIKMDHYPLMSKRDIHPVNIRLSKINKVRTFDNIYRNTRPVDLRAYSISTRDAGIAGFVEDIETDSIPYYKVSWNNLEKNIQNKKNKTNIQNKTEKRTILEKNELSSIYVLLKLYANKFHGKRVQIYCDNVSVIGMLNADETSPIKTDLKPIINKITSICKENQINPYWSRIVGVPEIAADRLIHGIDDPFEYSSFKPQSKPDSMGVKHLNDIINTC